MSLLTDASLIVTPNAYKAGTLYSVIPNTTLGDMTVVRATTATRVNSAGLIESVAINAPRLDYTGGGCPRILVEPLRTNVILQSETFDNASWNKNASGINTSIGTSGIESNVANAPSGTLTADRVNFIPQIDLDLGLNQLYASAVATQSFVSSIYVKGEGSNIGKQIRLRIKRSLGGSYAAVDTTITLTSDWVRITSSALTLLALNTGVQYIISSNDATNALIWGAQLEQGSNATSYIPTTTAAVPRDADEISKTGVSTLIGQTEGTLYFEVQGFSDGNTVSQFITLNDGTTTNQIGFNYTQTLGRINGYFRVNGSTTQITSTVLKTLNSKIILKYNSSYVYTLFINGSLIGTANALNPFSFPLTAFKASQGDGGFPYNGNIKSIVLWKTPLSDDQCILLTGPSFSSYPEMASALIYTLQ